MKSREILHVRRKFALIAGFICIVLIPLLMTPFIVNFVIADQDSSLVNNFNCSSLTSVKTIDNTVECVSEPYTGALCMQLLATTQSCSVGARNSVLVNASGKQQLLETNLTTFLSILERNGSQQCRDAALPFMCQYTFPLCDNSTTQLYLPTQERCIEISEQVCSQEWNLTRQLEYQNLLPNCTTLRSQAFQNITCREDFISLNGTCQARCEQNDLQSSTTIAANRVFRFAGVIIAILGGGTFFIASVVRYKEMFSFPLIILVYMTAEIFILGIVGLVTESGFPALLCGSVTLTESILNPTILCLISGAVYHYTIVGIYVFWTFHISYFFYKVMFPFHANAHQSYKKYIHLIMAIFGFLAPIPAVIIALAVDNYRYSIGLFFLPACLSKNRDLTIYSITLVISILTLISTILLILIIWKIHKHSQIKLEHTPLLSTAEKKLLLVLSLSIVAGLIIFASVVTSRITVKTQESIILEYFNCESSGYVPGKCNKAVQQDSVVWFTSASLLVFGATPLFNLLFVINFKTVKEKIKSAMHGPTTLSNSNREHNGHPLQNLTSDEQQKPTSELLETIVQIK